MTKKTRTDYFGTWEIEGNIERLIKPSKEYLAEREKEQQEILKKEQEREKLQAELSILKEKVKNKSATLSEIQRILELIL